MTLQEIALQYMSIFFSGRDLHRLYDIFVDDLIFEGPFHSSNTAAAYIESLIADPPIDCSYVLQKSFANKNCVNLIYDFRKPGIAVTMCQVFEFRGQKICRIQLIFDSAVFER